ncbi:MAG: Ada metal-binding domain-containing protein [bacterium]
MLKYKELFIKNQDKIVLCVGVILIALIAFGLGRLSYNIGSKSAPIEIIDNNIFRAEIGETISEQKEGIFVGSKNSNKYHLPDCTWAKKIKKENEIWFKSEKEAQEKGYQPCSCISHK